MKQLQINFRGWLGVFITVLTMLFSGNLTAQTKNEDEAKPKLLRVEIQDIQAKALQAAPAAPTNNPQGSHPIVPPAAGKIVSQDQTQTA